MSFLLYICPSAEVRISRYLYIIVISLLLVTTLYFKLRYAVLTTAWTGMMMSGLITKGSHKQPKQSYSVGKKWVIQVAWVNFSNVKTLEVEVLTKPLSVGLTALIFSSWAFTFSTLSTLGSAVIVDFLASFTSLARGWDSPYTVLLPEPDTMRTLLGKNAINWTKFLCPLHLVPMPAITAALSELISEPLWPMLLIATN